MNTIVLLVAPLPKGELHSRWAQTHVCMYACTQCVAFPSWPLLLREALLCILPDQVSVPTGLSYSVPDLHRGLDRHVQRTGGVCGY